MTDDKIPEIFLCREPCSGPEGFLQERWNRIPLGAAFRTESGQRLELLSRGDWNLERGPDFKKAKILLNGQQIQGDIEIHRKSSDWGLHGHSGDPHYRNVILHVVALNDGGGPENVPVLIIPSENTVQKAPPACRTRLGDCHAVYAGMSPENLFRFFEDAGVSRLHERAQQLLPEMIRSGAENTFLGKLFECAGGKNNRETFRLLFQNTVLKYPQEIFRSSFEALLWGESGLLPAAHEKLSVESAAESSRLWKMWWALRFDAGTPMLWDRSAARPAGTPERKIAFLTEFLRKKAPSPLAAMFEILHTADSPEDCGKKLMDFFRMPGPDFWRCHASFTADTSKSPVTLCGTAKALELVIDAALPCLEACALLKRDYAAAERAALILRKLPVQESNSVIRKASEKWFRNPAAELKHLNTAAARQGIHCIWKEYCLPASFCCSACLIRNSFRQ